MEDNIILGYDGVVNGGRAIGNRPFRSPKASFNDNINSMMSRNTPKNLFHNAFSKLLIMIIS